MSAATLRFDNSYARLPEHLYHRQQPEQVPAPGLIRINRPLAEQLGFDPDWLASEEGVALLAGNSTPPGADPIATVYAGHQFGSYNPQLGDGRALLLGELIDRHGQRFDLQLKGSGRTPYSRGGDGKSPLGPVLREYIISEAMYALGVPTTRALGAVYTGESVYRERPLPGAVLCRVAKSHIRVGTMQFFAAQRDTDALRTLAEHVIQRHYPEAANSDKPIVSLLVAVMQSQAELVAHWQSLGFIHGVMNTDNMLLSGETIDYGPCAFMDDYHPGTVFSSIDQQGRYAFGNQPAVAHWNLAQLAQALLPIIDDNEEAAVEEAQDALNSFPDRFFVAYRKRMADKLGLAHCSEDDQDLYEAFLDLLSDNNADFTLAFRRLTELADESYPANRSVAELFEFSDAYSDWLNRWQARLAQDKRPADQVQGQMRRANPLVIPRNHRVEEVITAAIQGADFTPFHRLVDEVTASDEQQDMHYARPPEPQQRVQQTFCGT
ncbi:YdiU family protein [Spongiibacter nanhainus]|uniref:Protein nucleotidyltransferase YdiU n=1 Tax=Spongiibacter nanhainus TaxID=2794344 RepID=A0A7T4R3I4_9GAMM|nr:YdiU family protein [Spongiibacter nanhainus]QQD19594.1 YdiU family protein [Spongiibacter nanhainus]